MIAISIQENPPNSFEQVFSLVYRKCMAAQYAFRSTVHTTLKYSPGELAYGRNMLLPFSAQVNWPDLLQHKQNTIDKTNIRENKGRHSHDYRVGDMVLILNRTTFRNKLAPTTLPEGPWKISQVHTNGTVSILRNK